MKYIGLQIGNEGFIIINRPYDSDIAEDLRYNNYYLGDR